MVAMVAMSEKEKDMGHITSHRHHTITPRTMVATKLFQQSESSRCRPLILIPSAPLREWEQKGESKSGSGNECQSESESDSESESENCSQKKSGSEPWDVLTFSPYHVGGTTANFFLGFFTTFRVRVKVGEEFTQNDISL